MNILSFTVGFLLLVILSVVIVAEFFPSVSAQKNENISITSCPQIRHVVKRNNENTHEILNRQS
jgi:hypothetical protein